MKKLLLVGLAGLLVGGSASAAVSWRVFATATDSGEFSTYASANAKVVKPKALAVRAVGAATEVSWSISCDGRVKGGNLSNRVIAASVANAQSCSLYGSAFGDGGTLRVQLLRR
jgi:hypothetical protein